MTEVDGASMKECAKHKGVFYVHLHVRVVVGTTLLVNELVTVVVVVADIVTTITRYTLHHC